jgi:DNA-binding winged helix-turn-helix (wHTH) protein
MKVLFIETEFFLKEKLLKVVSSEKSKRNFSNPSHVVTLHDSSYTTEELLKELDLSSEMIQQLSQTDISKILIVVNDGLKLRQHNVQVISSQDNFDKLEYKNFTIHLKNAEVYIFNKRLKLTSMEYKLLLYFISNAKTIISRHEIIEHLWGKGESQLSSEVTMYTHIKNLRRKLLNSGLGNFIHTIYNQGYKFEDPDEVL